MRFNPDTLDFEQEHLQTTKLAFAGSDGEYNWGEFRLAVDHFRKIIHTYASQRPVIIYGHKQRNMPAAITACLTEGVPYIPADHVMPAERIYYMAEITGADLLINCSDQLLTAGTRYQWFENTMLQPESGFEKNRDVRDGTAYIMFTSGSTGKPKGVMIGQESVRSFSRWMNRDFHADENSVFMNQAPFSFDISLVELTGTLSLGASCVLNANAITKTGNAFCQRLQEYKCSYWNSTPSFAYMQLPVPDFCAEKMPHLRHFLFMGEELSPAFVQRLRKKFPDAHIYNAYGPTEATVVTTFTEIQEAHLQGSTLLPIGKRAPHSELWFEANDGGEGELVIGGPHVSLGYINRPDLNETRFGLYAGGKRFFRTGDFGYEKNGQFYFTGRRDEQVKLNGYRIEINEINASLENLECIRESVTIALRNGNQVKKIIAFIKTDVAANISEIKDQLGNKMPAYMIPSEIIPVETFPYNSNHKIDRSALQDAYLRGEFHPGT